MLTCRMCHSLDLSLFLCADVLTCGSNPLFSVHCKLELYNPEVSCRPICFLDRGGEHLHQFYWTISSLCGCFILLSKSIPRPADLQVSSAHQVCSPMSKALHPEFQGCLNPGEQMSSTSFIFTNYLWSESLTFKMLSSFIVLDFESYFSPFIYILINM